jgi:hypothetical protein
MHINVSGGSALIDLYYLESEGARRVARFVAAAEDARRLRDASPAGARRPWLAVRRPGVEGIDDAVQRPRFSARPAPASLACCPA